MVVGGEQPPKDRPYPLRERGTSAGGRADL